MDIMERMYEETIVNLKVPFKQIERAKGELVRLKPEWHAHCSPDIREDLTADEDRPIPMLVNLQLKVYEKDFRLAHLNIGRLKKWAIKNTPVTVKYKEQVFDGDIVGATKVEEEGVIEDEPVIPVSEPPQEPPEKKFTEIVVNLKVPYSEFEAAKKKIEYFEDWNAHCSPDIREPEDEGKPAIINLQVKVPNDMLGNVVKRVKGLSKWYSSLPVLPKV